MRIIKKILFAFLGLLISICVAGYFYFAYKIIPDPNQLSIKENSFTTTFEWVSIQTNNGLDSNGAMLVPVYLKGCPKRFYMQFDLGHPTTIFYKCVLDKINSKYHNIPYQQNSDKHYLNQFNFFINQSLINAKKVSAMDCTVSNFNWDDSISKVIIGTIGSDIIENKVTVIDYPLAKIYIGDKIPDGLASSTQFSKFKFKYRRILLPSTVGGENKDIFFDTGTSAFELMTDKDSWDKLSKNEATVNTFDVNNWGKKWVVHSVATDDSIKFNSTTIPLKYVTYVDGPGMLLKLAYKISGVGGLTGNKLFLNKRIVIDTKRLKFAIVN